MRRSFEIIGLSVLALALPYSITWAAEPHQEYDSAIHILAGHQDPTEIPGSCPAEETRHSFAGLGYSHFLAEDVSFELAGWLPLGGAGAETFSASAGLSYYFDHLFIPLAAAYRGDLDSWGVGTGLGLDFPVGERTILRGQAGPQYLVDGDIEDQWTWSAVASIGWRLGDRTQYGPGACKCPPSPCKQKCKSPCRCKHQKGNR